MEDKGRGLAVLWDRSLEVEMIYMSNNHVDMEVRVAGSGTCWRAMGFYGFSESQNKQESWELLRTLGQTSDMPWIIFGDFNQVMRQQEKQGGNQRKNGPRRFRFEEIWLSNEECETVVKEAWESCQGSIQERIGSCSKKLDHWGQQNFGDIPRRQNRLSKFLFPGQINQTDARMRKRLRSTSSGIANLQKDSGLPPRSPLELKLEGTQT
ncbi:hypothetical protein Ahy_B05g076153 [Arachis hypogaea]|uniref:Endonuclease/exonuclease/phosphatase domain-containing protein n=1 Tax=Arachis hypogaea TaxID=3818 RepID=A0A444Z2N7_ARAHY|nr:hypothetical protein Ahy_B05g076153 [Arachis hypogaea]